MVYEYNKKSLLSRCLAVVLLSAGFGSAIEINAWSGFSPALVKQTPVVASRLAGFKAFVLQHKSAVVASAAITCIAGLYAGYTWWAKPTVKRLEEELHKKIRVFAAASLHDRKGKTEAIKEKALACLQAKLGRKAFVDESAVDSLNILLDSELNCWLSNELVNEEELSAQLNAAVDMCVEQLQQARQAPRFKVPAGRHNLAQVNSSVESQQWVSKAIERNKLTQVEQSFIPAHLLGSVEFLA